MKRRSPTSASPWRRLAAGGVDYLLLAPWLAVLAAAGFGLRQVGVLGAGPPQSSVGRVVAQLVVVTVLALPYTLWLAWWEASRGATPGKRLFRLRVDNDGGGPLSFRQATLRSAVKVALPWEIGHAAVWQTWGRDVTGLTVVLVALAYLVVGAHLVLVFAGGRPIYDRLAATTVRPAPFIKAPQTEATSKRHRLVQSRMAIWLLGSAVGVAVVALPDDDARVLTLSRAHGPSLLDGLGIVILIAAWVPLVALLSSSLSALRCRLGFGAATLAVAGAFLLAVTIGGDRRRVAHGRGDAHRRTAHGGQPCVARSADMSPCCKGVLPDLGRGAS